MTESTYRTVRAEDALAEMSHHLTQAAHHTKKAHDANLLYLSLIPGGDDRTLPGLPNTSRRRKAPKCVAAWTDHIRDHGPGTRQEVEAATGVRFNERAYPYTVQWEDDMVTAEDDAFMPDALFRIRSVRPEGGRGGAPVIFFLWSQRYDLYREFEVGPPPRAEQTEGTVQPLLGVVQPPEPVFESTVGSDMVTAMDDSTSVEETSTVRFDTLHEWHGMWDEVFDALAPYDAKPTDEEMEKMLATLPEDLGGEQPKAILAVSYSDARRRMRNQDSS